jgi:hypothetical protein
MNFEMEFTLFTLAMFTGGVFCGLVLAWGKGGDKSNRREK